MKNILKVVLLVAFFTTTLIAQFSGKNQSRNLSDIAELPADFKHIPKKIGHYTADDWAAVIDSTWGPGLPTATKLQLFDIAWITLNAKYAAFQNLEIDWNEMRNLYRPEIEAGVSRGRFAAIMNYLGWALMEMHTYILDVPVAWDTPLEPGVPLFVTGSPGNVTHFGAALSPLPDSTLLVIKTIPNHPLGLIPGDIVLGYDGILWKNLYKEILEAQLPWSPTESMVSSESAHTHILLSCAGMNWHLFDTLDVVQYATGDTLHFPTSLLAKQSGFIWANEQLPVPGVPFPDFNQGEDIKWGMHLGDYVSWGIVEGTQIGYIYLVAVARDWPGNIKQKFYNAIDSLMNYHTTKGLILDIRLHYGGNTRVDDLGLSLLFNSYIKTASYRERCGDPNNHFQMCSGNGWTDDVLAIKGNPESFYDKPIAVLSGPATKSMGDQLTLKMKYHPMARLFGKSPAGGFSFWDANFQHLPHNDWWFAYTKGNTFIHSSPGNYLTHTDLEIDEQIWLTQEDVAKGEDTVVKRAIEWINYMIETSIDENVLQTPDIFRLSQNYPNPFNPTTAIEFTLPQSDFTTLKVYNILGKEVAKLVSNNLNPGNHTYQFDGKNLASGVYYYQIVAGEYREEKKMILIR